MRLFQPDSDALGTAQCKEASCSVSSLLMHSLCWKNNLVHGSWAPVRSAQDRQPWPWTEQQCYSLVITLWSFLCSPLLTWTCTWALLSDFFSESSQHPPPVKWNTVPYSPLCQLLSLANVWCMELIKDKESKEDRLFPFYMVWIYIFFKIRNMILSVHL